MSNEDFKGLMKKANLNKKAFSELLNVSYNAVNGWGTNGRDYPYWVESWLTLYIDNQSFKRLKSAIKDSGACE